MKFWRVKHIWRSFKLLDTKGPITETSQSWNPILLHFKLTLRICFWCSLDWWNSQEVCTHILSWSTSTVILTTFVKFTQKTRFCVPYETQSYFLNLLFSDFNFSQFSVIKESSLQLYMEYWRSARPVTVATHGCVLSYTMLFETHTKTRPAVWTFFCNDAPGNWWNLGCRRMPLL